MSSALITVSCVKFLPLILVWFQSHCLATIFNLGCPAMETLSKRSQKKIMYPFNNCSVSAWCPPGQSSEGGEEDNVVWGFVYPLLVTLRHQFCWVHPYLTYSTRYTYLEGRAERDLALPTMAGSRHWGKACKSCVEKQHPWLKRGGSRPTSPKRGSGMKIAR